MRIILTSILLLLLVQNGICQSINESFIIKAIPDAGWFLNFDKNNQFEYYYSNLIGGSKLLSSGKYSIKDKLVTFNSFENDSIIKSIFPNKLYLKKIRVYNKYKRVTGKYIIEKNSIFGKKYLILSENLSNDNSITGFRPGCSVMLTRQQYKRKKDIAYFLSSGQVKFIKKWNHKKIKNYTIINNRKATLFKEISSIDKKLLSKYESEINETEPDIDYTFPYILTFFDELGDEIVSYKYYYYTRKLSRETLQFLNKLNELFGKNIDIDQLNRIGLKTYENL